MWLESVCSASQLGRILKDFKPTFLPLAPAGPAPAPPPPATPPLHDKPPRPLDFAALTF